MAKPWVRPLPKTWWLSRPTWRRFMLREWTSAFVAAYAVFLLVLVSRADGPADGPGWTAFVDALSHPCALVFHALVLAMACVHTVTWFAAAPKALRVFRGEDRVPEALVAGAHFAAWAVVSLVVLVLVLA
jgi:fumarate reductase subunit C